MPAHPLVSLAIRSIKHQLENGRSLPCPDPLPEELKIQAGTFVSIKKNRLLRGCIGTIQPKYANLAEEVIQNAIKAANEDPRFPPIEMKELDQLTISVDILTPPEKIADTASLDVKRYGMIVRFKGQQGLLLPNLENIKSVDQQLKICLKKGGIKETEPYELFRFEVKRFH
ncbi:MAG: AmmeMemoRadiSam system protein A [Nitrospina sp.]|jgi:AmmeMemoRadiSam system protein A|nr:AmmeMemoRadiSam system protein A [Nitrospina sp.]MBT3510717.1 AmmeMemoRadiSam system protein A [Nitrospina sp.]MBT3875986.1 AmmeMemoRadiSam system protein A [Nitrospina sp.]MBT4048971.1 AmmeMemoRadiSam system protein A [Nitrospina sp.]MBT4557649.1 AmmeMemoRadiSam system protein A [Nitrospina sp.]